MVKITTIPIQNNINRILSLLGESPAQLEALSESLTEEQLSIPLASNEWSFKENLAHLLSCEVIISQSIYYALLVDNPILPNVHPQRQWAQLVQYEHFSISAILGSYYFSRETLRRVLADLTFEEWQKVVSRESKRPKSVYRLARTLALHEYDHLQDIASKLNKET